MRGLDGRQESADQARRSEVSAALEQLETVGSVCPGPELLSLFSGVSAGESWAVPPSCLVLSLCAQGNPAGSRPTALVGAAWPGVGESEQLINRILAGGGSVTHQRGVARNLPAKQAM